MRRTDERMQKYIPGTEEYADYVEERLTRGVPSVVRNTPEFKEDLKERRKRFDLAPSDMDITNFFRLSFRRSESSPESLVGTDR